MSIEIKLNAEKNFKLDIGSVGHFTGTIWNKSRTVIFFVLLVLSILTGGLIWRQSLLGAGWSQERKQEFLDSQNKNVEFKQQSYQKVTEQIEDRKNQSLEEYQPIKDIFASYK